MEINNGAEQEPEPLLRVEGVKKGYPVRKGIMKKTVDWVQAVDGVSFDLYPGETLGLVGESGSGKSSLALSIVGLEKPEQGRILFSGTDIASCTRKEMKKLRTDIQMIFQDPRSSLDPRKSVYDILAEPLSVHRLVSKSKIPQRVHELMDNVGLADRCKAKFPAELSGGERQRIGIARALALRPKLIVCDEPVSALDVSIQAQVLNLLKDLQRQFRLTYLFITHGLGSVQYVSDRIAVMYLGNIVELGTADDIFHRAKHPYTKALLGAHPISHPKRRRRDRVLLQGEAPSLVTHASGCKFYGRCPNASDLCGSQAPQLSQSQSSGTAAGHSCACFHYD